MLENTGFFRYNGTAMNEKVLKTLEFDKIIDRLSEKCLTPIGKTAAKALVPMDVLPRIERAQTETEDALSRLYRLGSFSASGARDIRDSLLRLKVQANLSMPELLSISMLLRTADRVRHYGIDHEEETGRDSLSDDFSCLDPLTAFQKEIDRCIISEEEMADDASSGLLNVRRRMKNAAAKVRSELQSMVVSSGSYLREHVITMRNGRYCLPVKSEYRQMVPGMIHDESGSGSTVFIEPMGVVKLNNEIRELEIQEAKEIEAVLAKLSAEAEAHAPVLDSDLKILSRLDFIFARAALAREMNATRPVFNTEKRIALKQARHPLLDPKTAVPIDVRLGGDFDTLIVTGPNTGGKTVSLKTVGLLTLMGEAGLHIPAVDGSELGLFSEVFADIGDEQSIEQSLSTFSSHMKNLTAILRRAGEGSLVLLDELCAGTDPEDGAHLAIAILNALRRVGAVSMATTHYSELKLYALSENGVENASCEFNVHTLSPTYKLLIGIPGRSNAFAISKRLGLPKEIIEEAENGMDRDDAAFEDIIRDLHDSKRRMEKEQSKIGRLKAEARDLKENLDREEAKIEEKRERILAEARAEAQKMLQEAKTQVDETIRVMNKQGKDVRELEKVRTETREMLQKTAAQGEAPEKREKSATKAEELRVGDRVRVLPMDLEGTLLSLPDKSGSCFVQVGILRSQFHLSDLQKLADEGIRLNGKALDLKKSSYNFSKSSTISPEINLIGKTTDVAVAELEKYLDDAYLSHLPEVRIVHGRGTGALRNAVHGLLKRLKYISSYKLGEFGEGDTGVTIATFK